MQCNKTSDPDHDVSSSSYEYNYVMDPNASEEELGVFYTPLGFERVKRLELLIMMKLIMKVYAVLVMMIIHQN